MLVRYRRAAVAVFTLGVMVAAAVAVKPDDKPVHTFHVVLGLKDKMPADWSGSVAVADGEVTSLTGWRFEDKDAVDGTSGWKCSTRNGIALGERFATMPAGQTKEPLGKQMIWPNGVVLKVRGDEAAVTLKLPGGEVKFKAGEIPLADPKTYLNGQVRVERQPATSVLRPPAPPKADNPVQDDYPAFWVRYKTGKQYLAWVAYQKEKDRVLLAERDGPEGQWSEPLEVAGPGDHFRTAIASTHAETFWIVWSSQRDKAWNLFGRPYKDGKLGEEIKLTEGAGPNMWHRMTTDNKGRAWLVWQGFKNGKSDIYARCADAEGWHDPIKITEGKGNNWDPTIAHDSKEDRVWVGWDTYDNGYYDVRICSLTGGPKPQRGEIILPAGGGLFGAHISLACDNDGRLWMAWDEAAANWGKDTGYLYQKSEAAGLYSWRRIRLKCLENGKWKEPKAEFAKAVPPDWQEFHQMPQLQPDSAGRMWLAFRYRTCKRPRSDNWAASGRWDVAATAFLGDRWLTPIELADSVGRNDMRVSSQRDPKGSVYFAYASDHRAWFPAGMTPRNHSISVTRVDRLPKVAPYAMQEAGDVVAKAVPKIHPKETEQVGRIRNYKLEHGGRTYKIYRGDLHRHTDISSDGIGDGSIMDLHRYALDVAALDFVLIGDHNMGGDNEYCWWRTQKANDLYTVPGSFISLYGYERSVPYPNGHRNIIWPERGHRTLPLPQAAIPKQMAEDTGKLYEYLRKTDGICTLHTSATGQGTNWEREIDPALEPFVEIFQGFHASFEAPGGPRIVDAKSDVIHTSYKPDGYVSIALDKGYRLGFQASSDHVSTHVSYACVLAEEFSRKGLQDAMKKRHAYAATDNIVLDVRMGSLGIMGDEVKTSKPGLDVVVLGTGPIERVDVIRNGKVVHTEKSDKTPEEMRFHWDDPAPVKGEKASYYYVRAVQKDGQLAWASPIWVRIDN
jgi:hypothetical protein